MSTERDLTGATWRKSSYSGGSGGECIEVYAVWRKSTYSGGEGGNCIEVADGIPNLIPVRDSKDPDGPALIFRADAWSAFVAGIKAGDFPPFN